MDVHLAWRAQCCKITGGEVFLGTAPRSSFRAAAALLAAHGVEVAPQLARLVVEFGMVLSLDGLVGPRMPLVGGLHLEGEGICDGYHPAMLTISMNRDLGEEYLRSLPQQAGASGDERHVGFLAIIGVEAKPAEHILNRVRQAGTIRMSELPQLVLGTNVSSNK